MRKNVVWSRTVKILTIILVAVLLITEVFLISIFFLKADWIAIAFSAFIFIVFVYFALQAPIYIDVNESRILLKKVVGTVEIKIEDVELIENYVPDITNIRLFGSGGFFGYVGLFRNSSFGKYRSYVGCYAQAFHIRTKSGKHYVFSCKGREALIGKIQILYNYTSAS